MRMLPEIKTIVFSEDQYYKVETSKKQIVLHHTASGRGSDGDYKHWLNNSERVATCVIIDRDGLCNQLYESKYWGHHIGLKSANNIRLNQGSVGVEIDAWGGLTHKNGVWTSYTGAIVPDNEVVLYPDQFKGFSAFHKYTDEQIESLRKLLVFWTNKYGIPKTYNSDMWNVSERAINGQPGIWTHVSYRSDKSDCHPQAELKQMLLSL